MKFNKLFNLKNLANSIAAALAVISGATIFSVLNANSKDTTFEQQTTTVIRNAQDFHNFFSMPTNRKFALRDSENPQWYIDDQNNNQLINWVPYSSISSADALLATNNPRANTLSFKRASANEWISANQPMPNTVITYGPYPANENGNISWIVFANEQNQIAIQQNSVSASGTDGLFLTNYARSKTQPSGSKSLFLSQTPSWFDVLWADSNNNLPTANINTELVGSVSHSYGANSYVNYTFNSAPIISNITSNNYIITNQAISYGLKNTTLNRTVFTASSIYSTISGGNISGSTLVPDNYLGNTLQFFMEFQIFNPTSGLNGLLTITAPTFQFLPTNIPIITAPVATPSSTNGGRTWNLTINFTVKPNNQDLNATTVNVKYYPYYTDAATIPWATYNLGQITAGSGQGDRTATIPAHQFYPIPDVEFLGQISIDTNPYNMLYFNFTVSSVQFPSFVEPEINFIDAVGSGNSIEVEYDYVKNDGEYPLTYINYERNYGLRPNYVYRNAQEFYSDLGLNEGDLFYLEDSQVSGMFLDSDTIYDPNTPGAEIDNVGVPRYTHVAQVGRGFNVVDLATEANPPANNDIDYIKIETSANENASWQNPSYFTFNKNSVTDRNFVFDDANINGANASNKAFFITTNALGQVAIGTTRMSQETRPYYLTGYNNSAERLQDEKYPNFSLVAGSPDYFNIVTDINFNISSSDFSADATITDQINNLKSSTEFGISYYYSNSYLDTTVASTSLAAVISNISTSVITTPGLAEVSLTFDLEVNGTTGPLYIKGPFDQGQPTPPTWVEETSVTGSGTHTVDLTITDPIPTVPYVILIKWGDLGFEFSTVFYPREVATINSFTSTSPAAGQIQINYDLSLNDSYLWVDFSINGVWYNDSNAAHGANSILVTGLSAGTYSVQVRVTSDQIFSSIIQVVVS